MKKNLLIPLLLVGLASSSQNPVFKVEYHTETYTFFKHPNPTLSSYELVKFMPRQVSKTTKEVTFNNGTSNTLITYLNNESNDWYDNPDQMMVQGDSVHISTPNEKISVKNQSAENTDDTDCSYVTFYLGTNPWQLPVSNEKINLLHQSGYEVLLNNTEQLIYQSETDYFSFDKKLKLEVWKRLLNHQVIETQTTGYRLDENNYWVYDYTLIEFFLEEDEPCISKIIYTQYSDIERHFMDEELLPKKDLTNINTAILTFSAKQLGNSNFIEFELSSHLENPVFASIKDNFGNLVKEDIQLTEKTTILSLPELRTGLYYIILSLPSAPQKIFIKP